MPLNVNPTVAKTNRRVTLLNDPYINPINNLLWTTGQDNRGFQYQIALDALPPGVTSDMIHQGQVWFVENTSTAYRLSLYVGEISVSTIQGVTVSGIPTYPKQALTSTSPSGAYWSTGLDVYSVSDSKYAVSGTIGVGNVVADTAAFNAAAQDMINNGSGVLMLPATTLNISSFPTLPATVSGLSYSVKGYGKNVSVINSYASSLSESLTVTAPTDFVTNAPEWSGFTIDGTNATNDAVGIHWSDVSYGSFRDILIHNFTATSGIGMFFHNQVGWTEGISMDSIELINNTTCIDFAISPNGFPSFDYWTVNSLYLGLSANQNGIVDEVSLGTQGGVNAGQVQHIGNSWTITSNCQTTYGTNNGVFFWLKGYSTWYNCTFNVRAEVDGSTSAGYNTHYPISMDATGPNVAYVEAVGTFMMEYFRSAYYGGGGYQFSFTGHTNLRGVYTTEAAFVVSNKGIATYIDNQPPPPTGGWATSVVPGQQFINYWGGDLQLLIPITMASGSTMSFVMQTYSITTSGAVILTAPQNQSFIFTLKMHSNDYMRIDLSSGTIGSTQAFWG